MISRQIQIKTLHGLHMRPAGQVAEFALNYPCSIQIVHGDKTVNAKSLLGVLSLCIRQNTEVTIRCEGEHEEQAMEEFVAFMEKL